MTETRCLAATGALGSGFKESSLRRGLELDPHFIGCDAGSTDFGPYYLGSGESHFPPQAVARDVGLIVEAARSKRIPVILGSAGTGGTDVGVDALAATVEAAIRRGGEPLRVARIYCEQDPAEVARRFEAGQLQPLSPTIAVDRERIEGSAHIVAMAGTEPIEAALSEGADVVVAGRCSDAAIFATVPLRRGADPGLAWHAGKLLECGAACVQQRAHPDCLFVAIGEESFTVRTPNPDFAVSTLSVASHNLYEAASPHAITEPPGTIHTEDCTYTLAPDGGVVVSGARFVDAEQYSIKLEGAELIGHQSIVLGGIRDSYIVADLDRWLARTAAAVHERIEEGLGLAREEYSIGFRRYGLDGSMGEAEPLASPGHEIGLVIEVIAATQELAGMIARSTAHVALHYPVEKWDGLISTIAFPYSPPELDRGPVYGFNLNHVVKPAVVEELFRIDGPHVVGDRPAGVAR